MGLEKEYVYVYVRLLHLLKERGWTERKRGKTMKRACERESIGKNLVKKESERERERAR